MFCRRAARVSIPVRWPLLALESFVRRPLIGASTRALLGGALACVAASAALGDARQLSLMPDPRGEFIRLCAPFMASRYAHPEAICDCVRTALISEIGDPDIRDALLYGVTERGVPTLSPAWLPPEKRALIGRT